MISKAMQKVGNEGVITVEEAKGIQTEPDVVEGMQFDRGYLSPYFVTNADKMTTELENPLVCFRKSWQIFNRWFHFVRSSSKQTLNDNFGGC